MLKFLTNKHVIVAMIVAPILAVIAWYAVDSKVAEKPKQAQEGGAYRLLEMPTCRWSSGECSLKNNDFELEIRPQVLGNNQLNLTVSSDHPLEGISLSVVKNAKDESVHSLKASDDAGLVWTALVPNPAVNDTAFRIVAKANGALYFGEVVTTFLQKNDRVLPKPDER